MQAVDLIKRYMTTFSYGLHDGSIFKKVKESKFTYVYFSTIKHFLLKTLGNPEVAEQIHNYVPQLTTFLSEKSCRLIEPILLDFNFIECQPTGYCFNISEKCFQKDPNMLKGSPRAFIKYTYTGDVPNPKPFIEGKLIVIVHLLFNYRFG